MTGVVTTRTASPHQPAALKCVRKSLLGVPQLHALLRLRKGNHATSCDIPYPTLWTQLHLPAAGPTTGVSIASVAPQVVFKLVYRANYCFLVLVCLACMMQDADRPLQFGPRHASKLEWLRCRLNASDVT